MKKLAGIILILSILSPFAFFIGFFAPSYSNAQQGATDGKPNAYTSLAPLDSKLNTINLTSATALSDYLNAIVKFLIIAAGFFAVLMIVLGGIQYMSTDIVDKKSEGKEKLKSAVFGLILALVAVLFLQTINPQLLSTTLKVEPQTIKSGGSVDGDPTNGATGGNPQSYAPLVDLPGFSGTVKVDNLDVYLNTLFKLGIGLAAAFAIIMIVIGGIQYYSTDVVSGKSEGKERIKGAILGLILALLGVLILQTINPQLLSTKLEVPLIDVQGIEVFVEGDPGDDTLPNVDPIQKNPPVVPTVNNVCEKEQKQISTLQEYINCGCFAAKDHSGRAGQVSPIVAYVKANLGSMFPGKPVTVVSDFRSVEHNHNVGGASKSDHLTGNAIDIGDGNSRMNEALANEIVSYFQSHGEYGATKIIYNKILYKAGGSQAASDHIDHVHVSFAPVASCN